MSPPAADVLAAIGARLVQLASGYRDSGDRVRLAVTAACDGAAWEGRAARQAGQRRVDRTQELSRAADLLAEAGRAVAAMAATVDGGSDEAARMTLAAGADAGLAGRLAEVSAGFSALGRLSPAALSQSLVDPRDARVLAALGLLDRSTLPTVQVLAELRGLAAAGDPVAVRAFVDSLSTAQQAWLVTAAAALVGGLDGVPPRLRYAANRVVLREAVAAAVAAHQFARAAHLLELLADPRRQFLLVDPRGDGRVEEVFGDLDAAQHVSLFVPGITHTIDDYDDPGSTRDAALAVQQSALAFGRGAVATIAWLGYDTPGVADSPYLAKARVGAPALVRTVTGLLLRPGVTATVVAHSYGTLVAGMAVRQGMQVDNLVLLGSPGIGVSSVGALHSPQTKVFAARAPGDLVGLSENFGTDPTDPRFGATRLATGTGPGAPSGHSHYLRGTSDCTRNVGAVTVGDYDAVRTQGPGPFEALARPGSTVAHAAVGPAVGRLPEPVQRVVHLGDRLVDPDLAADAGTDAVQQAWSVLHAHPVRLLPLLP